VTIKPNKVEELQELLAGIREKMGKDDCPIAFNRLTTVHFMRWVVIKDEKGRHPSVLVLSTNYDHPEGSHLEELVREGGSELEKIYSHCEGYEPGGNLLAYLHERRVSYNCFYVGTTGRSVRLIQHEALLRDAIRNYIDNSAVGNLTNPQEIREAIIRFVQDEPGFAQWACSPPTRLGWRVFNYLPFIVLGALASAYCVAMALVPVLFNFPWWGLPLAAVLAGATISLAVAVPVAILARLVLVQERRDAVAEIKVNVAHIERLIQREDKIVQNQLTHLVDIKPQWFRPYALRVVLAAINLLARYVYIRGTLGGIPTIHFARWVIIPGRRLLFFSNYDGSWENYLGDFIDKAAEGLTAVWSNTEGCPRAERFVKAGAKDEQRFKSWTRDHQVFTDVWFSQYPELTVDNINNNSFIRLGLAGRLGPAETMDWLARI
jgi:hypothetical protein